MTPLENSLYLALVTPVLALVVSAFLRPAMAFRWNAMLIALSGIGGAVAGAYGAVAEVPFTMAVPMFYGMTVALDRFSAIFFLGISMIIAGAGMYALGYAAKHQGNVAHLRRMGVLIAAFVIGAQWVLLAGNIIGFITAWAVMTLSAFFLVLLPMGETHKTAALHVLTIFQLGVAALTAGLFILSSGALFSDFGTLAYLAEQTEPLRLAVGYGLLFFGFASTIGLVPMHRWFLNIATTVPAHIVALFRGTFIGVAFYGFIRCILFILPPLSVWFALPVATFGALTMIWSAVRTLNEKHTQSIFASLGTYGLGLTTIMLSGAMTFQALAQYDAMNVMLFAAFVHIILTSISGSGLALAGDSIGSNIDRAGGLAKSMPKMTFATVILLLCAIGFPPFATFTSMWMMGGTFKTMFSDLSIGTLFHGLPAGYAVVTISILVLVLISILFSVASVARVIIGMFLGPSRSESATPAGEATDAQLTPIVLLAFLSFMSGFALPQLFVRIGADPLTDAAGTFNGGIVGTAGTLRMGTVGIVVVGIVAILWYFRTSWIDSVPSFDTIEQHRTAMMSRLSFGNRFKVIWNSALEKLRR